MKKVKKISPKEKRIAELEASISYWRDRCENQERQKNEAFGFIEKAFEDNKSKVESYIFRFDNYKTHEAKLLALIQALYSESITAKAISTERQYAIDFMFQIIRKSVSPQEVIAEINLELEMAKLGIFRNNSDWQKRF